VTCVPIIAEQEAAQVWLPRQRYQLVADASL